MKNNPFTYVFDITKFYFILNFSRFNTLLNLHPHYISITRYDNCPVLTSMDEIRDYFVVSNCSELFHAA